MHLTIFTALTNKLSEIFAKIFSEKKKIVIKLAPLRLCEKQKINRFK